MKKKVLTLWIDNKTAENLEQLARRSYRSKAGVIRWLINQAAAQRIEIPERLTLESRHERDV